MGAANPSHAKRIAELRARAREEISRGALTRDYGLDASQSVGVLNQALATEIVCTLRYQFHCFMATGIHSQAIKEEFREHAREEQEHAERIAVRIKQLGGKPEMNPDVLTRLSHSEFKEGTSLADMIREDLIAERIAIESYGEMVRFFGTQDPVSRRMMEEILAKEEEHADDLSDLLYAMEPQNSQEPRALYFADEVPSTTSPDEAGGPPRQ